VIREKYRVGTAQLHLPVPQQELDNQVSVSHENNISDLRITLPNVFPGERPFPPYQTGSWRYNNKKNLKKAMYP
jgi:hypothetical protein